MLWVDDVVITLVCIPLPHHSVLHPASEKGGRTRKRDKGWDRGRVSEGRGGGIETWIEWNGGLSEMPDWFQMNLLTTTVPGHIQPLWLTVGAGSSLLPLYQTVIFLPFPIQNTFRFEKYFGSLLPNFLTVLSAICHPWNILFFIFRFDICFFAVSFWISSVTSE